MLKRAGRGRSRKGGRMARGPWEESGRPNGGCRMAHVLRETSRLTGTRTRFVGFAGTPGGFVCFGGVEGAAEQWLEGYAGLKMKWK